METYIGPFIASSPHLRVSWNWLEVFPSPTIPKFGFVFLARQTFWMIGHGTMS